jgi:hypothetical protein
MSKKITANGRILWRIMPILLLSGSAYAVDCPPGFHWERMNGVGCVRTDCIQAGGSYGYIKNCLCRDGKSCNEFVNYSTFDNKLCGGNCPVARLIMCVKPGETCPNEIKSHPASPVTDSPAAVQGGLGGRLETVVQSIQDYIRGQGYADEEDFICDTSVDAATTPLDELAKAL